MFEMVICIECRSFKLLNVSEVTSYKCTINSIINANPMSS
jgi:hypothetical protein